MTKNTNLDYSSSEFKELLNRAVDIVTERYQDLDTAPAFAGYFPDEIGQWFDEPIPEQGMDAGELLDMVRHRVVDNATLNIGPHSYAYVNSGGTQISIISELLTAAINQNAAKWHLAPVLNEIEKRVIQWGADFINYGEKIGGVLVSGGSAANLTGLTVARNLVLENENVRENGLHSLPPLALYASDEVHGCIDKSVELLGIGSNNLKKIPTDSEFRIDIKLLERQIEQDIKDGCKPFCIIGNAGTVNTGAIDDLETLAAIAKKHALWFHVDGAYGGLAAALNELAPLFKGMEKADSIAIDFHKWLYQPFEAGCVLVRNWETLKRTFYKSASYLSTDTRGDGRLDFNEHSFQLSRSAKGLKVWMSFKAYGSSRIKDAIRNDIELAAYLAAELEGSEDFELCNSPQLSATCFRYLGKYDNTDANREKIDQLNTRIIPELEQDGRVFITGTILNQRPVIRACLINHRKKREHVVFLIQVIREIGEKIGDFG